MKKLEKKYGFTLAEAMLATIILAIVSAAIFMPFITGAKIQAEGHRRTLAANLASELIELITTADFDDIVTTYNGYTENQGQVKDITGSVYSDTVYDNYSRKAECVYVYVNEESGSDEPLFIRATVTVYYNGAELVSIDRLISE